MAWVRIARVVGREGSEVRRGGQLVIGVDGGNTKTIAVVCDTEGHALGIGRGGCGNWEAVGEQTAAAVIREVMEQALADAGRRAEEVVHTHMGLAGQDWPDDEPRMRGALIEAGWRGRLTLENDGFSAIRVGAPEGHGIGVTAGTGICSAIIRPDGDKYFYGGFTDLGGGAGIDGEVVHAVIRAEDGRGPRTALTEGLLDITKQASVRDLVYAVHRSGYFPPRDTLRPLLFTVAAQGDPVAVGIVKRFAAELALCATNLIRRYDLADGDPSVVASGSLFMKTGPLLFDAFGREVLAVASRARLILTDHPPVMGAVRGALGACGHDNADVWRRVNAGVAEKGWFTAEEERA